MIKKNEDEANSSTKKNKKNSLTKKNFFNNNEYVKLWTNQYHSIFFLDDEELYNHLTLELFRTFKSFNKRYIDMEDTIKECYKNSDNKDKEIYTELYNKYNNFFSSCGYSFKDIFSHIYSKYDYVNFQILPPKNLNTINLLDDINRKDPKIIESCINKNNEDYLTLDKYMTISEISTSIPRNYNFHEDVSFTARFFLSKSNIQKTLELLKIELENKDFRSEYAKEMLKLFTKKEKFILMIFSYHMSRELSFPKMKEWAINKLDLQASQKNSNSINNEFKIYENKLNNLINDFVSRSINKNDVILKLFHKKYLEMLNELFLFDNYFFNKYINKELLKESILITKIIRYSEYEENEYIKKRLQLLEILEKTKKEILTTLKKYEKIQMKYIVSMLSKVSSIKVHTTLVKYKQHIEVLKNLIERRAEYLCIYEKLEK